MKTQWPGDKDVAQLNRLREGMMQELADPRHSDEEIRILIADYEKEYQQEYEKIFPQRRTKK